MHDDSMHDDSMLDDSMHEPEADDAEADALESGEYGDSTGNVDDAGRPALESAVRRVPSEVFLGPDGRAVRPCTPAYVTHRHLRMLDVRRGHRVLDIGVGSGLSAALLAQLADDAGQVTAVEIDPALASRAAALYAAHGHRVDVVTADGVHGHPPGAPYDRILAGTTPPLVPDAWFRQLRPHGVLLCGARISGLPGGYAIARVTADAHHRPCRVTVHQGGYMPMAVDDGEDGGEAAGAAAEENVTRAELHGRVERSLALLGSHDAGVAASFLASLAEDPCLTPAPIAGDDWFHLKNWLYALQPDGLLEATLDRGNGIGLGLRSADGAHAAIVTGFHLIADSADSPALAALSSLIRRWRESGSPSTDRLHGELHREGDGWRVRVRITPDSAL